MKKILITGGSGYLGTRLAINLKKKYKIFLGSRNNYFNRKAQDFTKCEVFPLDIKSCTFESFSRVTFLNKFGFEFLSIGF